MMAQTYQITIKQESRFQKQVAAMRTFFIVWLGQLVSITGSGMTGFALGVYVYQQTGSATQFALIALFNMLPRALLSPIAGVLADRWDRRKVMILTDLGAGLSTVMIIGLLIIGQLEIWHVYLATAFSSAFNALQVPAYSAAATLLVPKAQLGRVSGMIQLGDAMGQVVSPVLAGLLVSTIHIQGVLLIDMATFLIAVITLAFVTFPQPERTAEDAAEKGSVIDEFRYGWQYLTARPGLLGLIMFFVIGGFFVGHAQVLITPMVLSFTTPKVLGLVLSAGGLGFLAGSLVMSIWGGGRRRIDTVFGFYILMGLAILVAGLHPSVLVVAVGLFVAYFSFPLFFGASQAILRSKVALEVQGRVFSLRIMLVTTSFTIAYLVAGPLADWVFEPLLATGGLLAGSVGTLIGVGPGRGIGLMFLVMGVLVILTAVRGFWFPRLRFVEEELPDAIAD